MGGTNFHGLLLHGSGPYGPGVDDGKRFLASIFSRPSVGSRPISFESDAHDTPSLHASCASRRHAYVSRQVDNAPLSRWRTLEGRNVR